MQPGKPLRRSRFTGSPSRLRKSAVREERVGVHNQLWTESRQETRQSCGELCLQEVTSSGPAVYQRNLRPSTASAPVPSNTSVPGSGVGLAGGRGEVGPI